MTTARYDAVAAWYDAFVRGKANACNFALPFLFDLLGEVQGCDVCDLACGEGRIARELAQRGAKVVGVDLSSELLAMARREEEHAPLGIRYVQDNAEILASLADGQFDGAVCNMAL